MDYPIKDLSIAILEGYRDIGDKPYNVDVSLTGQNSPFGIAEVGIYIDLLIRKYGPPPVGLTFFILLVEHQHGTQFKAAIQFSDCTNKMDRYISKLENGIRKWDKTALAELRSINHPFYIGGKHS